MALSNEITFGSINSQDFISSKPFHHFCDSLYCYFAKCNIGQYPKKYCWNNKIPNCIFLSFSKPEEQSVKESTSKKVQTHHEDHLNSDQINELGVLESDGQVLSLFQDENKPSQSELDVCKDEAVIIDSNHEEESIQQCFPKKTMLVLSSLQIICGCLAILLQV